MEHQAREGLGEPVAFSNGSYTIVTKVSWRQKAPKLLLEEFFCLPTAPYLSHDATNPPPFHRSCAVTCCTTPWTQDNMKMGQGSQKPGCFLHLICCLQSEVSRRDETAAGDSHGLCLVYWSWYCGVTCRQSLILKIYKQNSLVNWIFELWVTLSFFMKVYLKALKTNWLTISEHKAGDKSSWVPGVIG